jgi:ubiquinone/menaquinone biosynthesis C-methylase UbiE
MTQPGDRVPYTVDDELSTTAPDLSVRAAMATFYKTNEDYARQQASHTANYFRRLLAVLEEVLTGSDVEILEIGAGSGRAILDFLGCRPAAKAIALDLSHRSLRTATSSRPVGLRAVTGNALQLPFRDRSVDAVVAFEVIEHLPDVAAAFDEMLRVVRRPGHIIVGLPNHASLWTPVEDAVRRRSRRAFGIERGRGASRWWLRNVTLAWRKRISRRPEFLYRTPVLNAVAGGDADAVYYAAPIDVLRFLRLRGARLVTTSAAVRFGWLGRFLPVEMQGSTVLAWRVPK